MGDRHQVDWVRRLKLTGPVLEVGSRRVPASAVNASDFYDYRQLFAEGTIYVGVDIEAGVGVDRVCDLSRQDWRKRLGPVPTFKTVLALSVFEHVAQPFVLAKRLTDLLRPGGQLVISAPFSWVYHRFPEDYWRFSPAGIKALFPDLRFDLARSFLQSTSGKTSCLADKDGLRPIQAQGVAFGEAQINSGVVTDITIVVPSSYLAEGVNVNMVGRK